MAVIEVLLVLVEQHKIKTKAKVNEGAKYLDHIEMVRQPGKRLRQDDESNMN